MSSVTARRIVNAPARLAWDAMADLGNIHQFNPHLAGSHVLDEDASCGVGTERVCDLKRGGALHERVIDWRAGESYTVEVQMPGMPVTDMRTTMAVRPVDAARCEVSMRSEYRPRFGPAGWLADQVMLRHVLRHMFAGVLEGLDRHLVAASQANIVAAAR